MTGPQKYGPDSVSCTQCGYFLPQPPHDPICHACGGVPASFGAPLSTLEWLYIAAMQQRRIWLKSGHRRPEDFARVSLLKHYHGEGQDRVIPGQSPLPAANVLRANLKEDAQAWRAAGCPTLAELDAFTLSPKPQ